VHVVKAVAAGKHPGCSSLLLHASDHAPLTEVGYSQLERDGVYEDAGGLDVVVNNAAAV
jgi:hypothetical protein